MVTESEARGRELQLPEHQAYREPCRTRVPEWIES